MAINDNPTFGGGGDAPLFTAPQTIPDFDAWYASDDPEAAKLRQALDKAPSFMKQDLLSQIKADYQSKAAVQNATAVQNAVPEVIEASKYDAGDIPDYGVVSEVDFSNAINALYDPSNIKRDLTGRNIQLDTADYFGDVMKSGTDDASEAYYQGKRADAEQSARAQREAAMQQLQETGRDTGGAGILSELMASSDLQRDTSAAALGAKAMMQDRKDAAAGKYGMTGADIQGGDDDWTKYYTGEQVDYGKNKSGILQTEEVDNVNRLWDTYDKNTANDIGAYYHNKDLPMQGFGMFSGANSDVRGEMGDSEAQARADHAQYVADQFGFDDISQGVDAGAKIFQLTQGAPPPPKYNNTTGEALYDPMTGKRYK